MEQGRLVKEAAGGMFYDPVALVSISISISPFGGHSSGVAADLRAIESG